MTCNAAVLVEGLARRCLLLSGHPGRHWSPVTVRSGRVVRWADADSGAIFPDRRQDSPSETEEED